MLILRIITAMVFAGGASYAFSFAIDLLVGALVGVYPATAYLPVVTWSVIATVLLLIAIGLAPRRAWLALPFIAFGALALFGAVVGTHPHSYAVAVLLFIQAAVLGRVFRQPRPTVTVV